MKKLFAVVLAALVMAAPSVRTSAQDLSKNLQKEYKAKMKQLNKEKWELLGSSRTLDVTLSKYYEALESSENASELVGYASRFQSKNSGHQTAVNDACRTYAQQCGNFIKGRIESELAGAGADVELEHFYAAYERLVEKEIQGELIEKFSLIRQIGKENGQPLYEMQAYFLVDEESAAAARTRAYESAVKDREALQKYAGKIGDLVKEAVR